MLTALSFEVAGMPETKGSWRPARNRRTGRVVLRPDNEREASWAMLVAWAARQALRAPPCPDGREYAVTLRFVLPTPPSRRRTGRRDIDKLARSVLDALTGIVWLDDEQACELHCFRAYARLPTDRPGMAALIVPVDAPVVRG